MLVRRNYQVLQPNDRFTAKRAGALSKFFETASMPFPPSRAALQLPSPLIVPIPSSSFNPLARLARPISTESPVRRIGERIALAAVLALLALLGGCDSAPPPATTRPVDDPAMQKAAVQEDVSQAEPAKQSEPAADPAVPVRKDGRIFIPELGWRDEAAFWELYASQPEQLPDSLDLYALHQLRQEYEREQGAGGGS